jgi:SagB-type dehydrogenase family enzyme
MDDSLEKLNTVYRYHSETKHHFQRYARSLGFLDWSSQPDPFRRYSGAEVVRLRLPGIQDQPTWDDLFTDSGKPAPVDHESISRYFYFSLALSAWKQVVSPGGEVVSRWALRVNPSSGNLHPTEGYVVNADGVFHYGPDEHVLEKRAEFEPAEWAKFAENLPEGAFLTGLTSIHWREAWKYGERAFRYCQHDVGHALGAMALSAACLGWRIRLLEGPQTAEVARLLGVDGQSGPEKEHADCLVAVFPGPHDGEMFFSSLPSPGNPTGAPNRLSREHQDWPIIPEVAGASEWSGGIPAKDSNITNFHRKTPDRGLSAHELVRGRRSAVSMDGSSSLSRDSFHRLLGRLMPAPNHPVFNAAPGLDNVSLVMFVHRVDGLTPGLYALVRHPDHKKSLRDAFRSDFLWEQPEGCPDELPLFALGEGDVRETSRQLSCGQVIAAEGAFSLGMLARFDHALSGKGPGMYPRLFWETGMIGQMLYLEAEAAGIRGTGIGCFFDDEVHRVLGIEDHSWQSLYHFTVGAAVDDDRLQTTEAY